MVQAYPSPFRNEGTKRSTIFVQNFGSLRANRQYEISIVRSDLSRPGLLILAGIEGTLRHAVERCTERRN